MNLKTKDVTQNTEYTTDTKETGYVNGNYGADAQYLGTSFNGKKVHFKISGVQAWTDINNVELYLYNDSYILPHIMFITIPLFIQFLQIFFKEM